MRHAILHRIFYQNALFIKTKMDANSDQSSNEGEIIDGKEPGASVSSVLVATDSYEEVEDSMTTTLIEEQRNRLPSGNIDEIRSDFIETQSQVNSTDASISDPSNSSLNHSSTNTPINECEVEEIEYVHTEEWRQHRKHIFMLSCAGKPIYSRNGNEEKLVTLMGVMQALVSVIQDGKDTLRCIVAGKHKFVFMIREHVILVASANTHETIQQITLQLTYIYNQVLSVLTYTQLARIFKERHNYDLRRLLTGAEKFLDNLMTMMETDPSCLLGAVNCLSLDSSIRDIIAQAIAQHAKLKDLVFAVLIYENKLICLVRMKKYTLHPMDLHLVFNLVMSSQSFKSAESWTPICLPKFDAGGYLHSHISYLDPACNACLLLLSVNKDDFFQLSECKHKIQEKLLRQRCLQAITDAVNKGGYKASDTGVPDLRHFLYKSRSTSQYTCPVYSSPYNTEEDRRRLFSTYQYLHHKVHSNSRPVKILYHVGDQETLLAWVTSGFELYIVFGPLISKSTAINAVDRLLKWIKKKEDKLFILNSPTF